MKQRKLKKSVVYGLYSLSFMAVLGSIYYVESLFINDNTLEEESVSNTDIQYEIPVINTSDTFVRPYVDPSVTIAKQYYNYQAEPSNQENSLIYYENTYLQNSGVTYSKDDVFDVVAILDGTVTSITEDQNLGKVIEITHSNDIISVYQSLGEISVVENQEIKQGDIIATSGSCNMDSEIDNQLHFELIIKGLIVNPEEYYDKKVEDL